jgi:hypothetical protein
VIEKNKWDDIERGFCEKYWNWSRHVAVSHPERDFSFWYIFSSKKGWGLKKDLNIIPTLLQICMKRG